MNIPNVIADLRQYKADLEQAIAALDRLARKRGAKRGRPLKTRKLSAATRMRMAAAQRRRWAARRKSRDST